MKLIDKIREHLKTIRIDYNKDVRNMSDLELLKYKNELYKEILRLWVNDVEVTREEMIILLNKLIEVSVKCQK